MSAAARFAFFDTPLGRCAVAWGASGIVGVQLPEADETRAVTRLRRRHPGAVEAEPPPAIRDAISRIAALLSGARDDLSTVALDMAGVPAFERQVYAVARQIPPGATLSYGAIAERLGDKARAREVGQAMGRNPFPIVVPCHRVVAADGRLGGFSAPGGVDTKLRMLAIEGAAAGGQQDLFG